MVVSQVRHGLDPHWKWDTWGDFFAAWFFCTVGVGIFTAIALAAIIYTEKFFLGYDKKDTRGLTFYIEMTVLVGALFIWFMAMTWSPSDDDDFDEGMDMGHRVAFATSHVPQHGRIAANIAKLPDLLWRG